MSLTEGHSEGPERLRFLDWLAAMATHYASATARTDASGRDVARAYRILTLAMLSTQNDGGGLSGRNHWFNTDAMARQLDWSSRKVERVIADLVDDGWLHRTTGPVRGRGRKPKASRYDLVAPTLSGDNSTPQPGASNGELLATEAPANLSPETELLATGTQVSSDTVSPERVAVNQQSTNSSTPIEVRASEARPNDDGRSGELRPLSEIRARVEADIARSRAPVVVKSNETRSA